MYNIGVAVVGAGFIGPVHVEALRRLGLPVRGILGCDDAESQRAMKAIGLPKAYGSLGRSAGRFERAGRAFGRAECVAL